MNNEQAVIDSLYAKYVSDGYITEDDIINICTEYDLPLHKIDHVCDKVISMGVLISDRVHQNMERNEPKTDELRDLSPIDYETLYYRCISICPDMEQVINYMRKILPPQKGEIKKLIVQARSGNAFARKKAIEMHMRTALRITMQYINKTDIPIEDLFSVACIAVIKAVDSYDAYIHNYFSQYVSFAIMLKIDRYIAENELLIKMPINRSDNMEKPVVESLDEIMENGDELFIYSGHDICEEVEKKIIAENIRSGLSLLKPKEIDIIRLRFALKDGKEYTLEEVGKIFGLTAQRIRQLEATALRKLKCRKYMLEFY